MGKRDYGNSLGNSGGRYDSGRQYDRPCLWVNNNGGMGNFFREDIVLGGK